MSFCTKCGRQVETGVKFCTNCGAPTSSPAAPGITDAVAPQSQATSAMPTAHVAPANGSTQASCAKIAVAAAVVLVLVAALCIGGGFYAYRSIKQKINSVLHKSDSAGTAAAPLDSRNSSPDVVSHAAGDTSAAFPPWQAGSQKSNDPAPLRQGMLVVTAIADAIGDYESFKEITGIDRVGVTLSYKSEHPKSAGSASSPSSSVDTASTRTVLTQDLNTAHDYAEVFSSNDPPSFPGTTAISASRDVLAELKQKGAAQFSFRPDGLKGAVSSLVNALSGIAGVDPKSIGDGSLAKASKEECSLQRDGSIDFAFPVLLNDQPVNLPAVHAHCRTDDGTADFYILDQDDYPLMLSWKFGEGSQLQVIKITYPVEPKRIETHKMESDLAEKRKSRSTASTSISPAIMSSLSRSLCSTKLRRSSRSTLTGNSLSAGTPTTWAATTTTSICPSAGLPL